MDRRQRLRFGRDFWRFAEKQHRKKVFERRELSASYTEFTGRRDAGDRPGFEELLKVLQKDGLIQVHGDTVSLSPAPNPWRSQKTYKSKAGGEQGSSSDQAEWRKTRKALQTLRKLARVPSHQSGISVTTDVPFQAGTLSLSLEDEYECSKGLVVGNCGAKAVSLTEATLVQQSECFTLPPRHYVMPLLLKPGDSCMIQFHFRCAHMGVYSAALVLKFKADPQASSAALLVPRFIEVECTTSLARALLPSRPYKRCPPAPQNDTRHWRVSNGQRPERSPGKRLKNVVPLPAYKMSPDIDKVITSLKQPSGRSAKRALLDSILTWSNYARMFHLLLDLDEHYVTQDFKKYNIPNAEAQHAVMKREGKLLILEVPGLAERRPSVLPGDELFVYPVGEKGVKYRGLVHSTEQNSVKLSFSAELLGRFEESTKFSVEFTFSRLTLRLQHRAADLAIKRRLEKVLFPAARPASEQASLPDLRFKNKDVEKNPEQKRVVQHIVAGSSKPAPYLIFGPPGTGKTVTMVEAIYQIEKASEANHILVCAPTNSAADLLWTKILRDVDPKKVYRMFSYSSSPQSVPATKTAPCNLEGNSVVFPDRGELMKRRIMVTTLFTAGRLVTGGIPQGHFTHVFVDEAGHAAEPECIIPLAGLLDPMSGQVVLAGDPKQLGPIVHSPIAKDFSLGKSLLERLMVALSEDSSVDGVFDERFVTKLLRNYRSHPDILEVPKELFYGGQLQAFADKELYLSCCQWEGLPQPGFPVIFHDVVGAEEREASSPSFFNRQEVIQLMEYLRKLMEAKSIGSIQPKEIGIIAPYRMQVTKIRKGLQTVQKDFKKDWSALKVGTVEEFQGEEKKVIMVSTVRSNTEFLNQALKFNMGFLTDDNRINVALTRAQALLIVVGNCSVLEKHDSWARFIDFCRKKGGFVSPHDNNIQAMRRQLDALDIGSEDETEPSEDQ